MGFGLGAPLIIPKRGVGCKLAHSDVCGQLKCLHAGHLVLQKMQQLW